MLRLSIFAKWKKFMTDQFPPICGADLERWRIGNGLSKVMAADAFGLQKFRWEELTGPSQSSNIIADPLIAMLLQLYQDHPEAAPIPQAPDIKEFYEFLGLEDTPQDREKFATLIGRSPPSVYRLLLHDGKPGRPLLKWLEAVRKLNLPPKKSLKLMTDVVGRVGNRQNVEKVLIQGWKRQSTNGDDE